MIALAPGSRAAGPMSLVDEWNTEISSTGLAEPSGSQLGLGGAEGSGAALPPLFSVEHRAEFLSR